MSCKLLLNLVECIRQRSEHESGNGKELLVKMMEVFVLKFKTVSKLQLPILMAKHKPPVPTASSIVAPSAVGSAASGAVSSTAGSHPTVTMAMPGQPPAPLTPGPPSLAPLPSPATPGNPQTPATPATPDGGVKTEPAHGSDVKPIPSPAPSNASNVAAEKEAAEAEKKNKFGFPNSQAQNYSVADCRALVKTLVCGVKTITWGLAK